MSTCLQNDQAFLVIICKLTLVNGSANLMFSSSKLLALLATQIIKCRNIRKEVERNRYITDLN